MLVPRLKNYGVDISALARLIEGEQI
ncbi:protein of unknown function [Burkholderia multivorans]